jgi:hypothetical protein
MPRKSAASLHFPTANGPSQRLRPPAELSESERQIFLDTIAGTKPGHFHNTDMPMLVAYCRATAAERRYGPNLDNDKALVRWNAALKALAMLTMRLRLCPQSRQPNSPSRPGRPEQRLSYYDEMALARREAAGA